MQWVELECQTIDTRQGDSFKSECQRLPVPKQFFWDASETAVRIAPPTSNIHRNTFQTDDVTPCVVSLSLFI